MSNVNDDSSVSVGGSSEETSDANANNRASEDNSATVSASTSGSGNGDDAVGAKTAVVAVTAASDDDATTNATAESEKGLENGAETTPKPVSRPPYIPPHLMGRDLNDPAQDMVGTGRRVQKPRLGVKVPYRNLTSQIVSQDEIAQEILERSMRKYSYSEAEGGDVFFAMKLTHRLANKITPSVESSNDKAAAVGTTTTVASPSPSAVATATAAVASGSCCSKDATSGNVTTSVAVVAMKKTDSAELSAKCNAMNVRTVVAAPAGTAPAGTATATAIEKIREAERKNDATAVKKCSENACKSSPAADASSNDASKSDSRVNFESKADQLYAEISSTLGEECKLGKPLKIASSGVNCLAKSSPCKMANGSINQTTTTTTTTTETELDNDTLLAILEGTSDVSDVSMNALASTPKVEFVAEIQQSPSPPTQQQQLPQQQPPPQHQRKKRIKPMLDPNVEKELALKQLMDFEKKKNEDRLKKSAAKKLKLDEETALVTQQHALTGATNNNNNVVVVVNAAGNIINNGVVKRGNDAIQGANVSTTVASTKMDTSPDLIKCEPASSAKKSKKNTFSGGSVAPKRFPKKYQRIIKRQLRSSKLKAKLTSPDQHQQQQSQKQQQQQPPAPQKKLPEVPEVQIAIDRYIKTYASKRKRKPEIATAAAAVAVVESKEKSLSDPSSAVAKNANRENSNAGGGNNNNGNDDDNRACSGADEEIKENSSPATTKPKANSKVMREINRLLGDEGAINMIYSIEQKRLPDNKRDSNILPSLRRKKKDLLLKTKLVKNAVLRLSMSPGQLSPGRVRRTSPEISTPSSSSAATAAASATVANANVSASARSSISPSRKASIESLESNASEHSPKLRKVAAEASRIIRRHSSSSAYSSDEDENGSVTETTTKPKPVVDKNAAVISVDAMETKSAKPSAATVEKHRSATNNSNSNHKINTRSNRNVENEERFVVSVEETKNGECDDNSATERDETAAGTVVGGATTTKRKDSKEASVGVVAKTQNESSNVSHYSELVERLHLKEITLRKYDNLVQIILISSSCKMKNAMNIQVFNELTNVLNELQKDESCRTVLLTSTGSSFCQGIDLQALIRADMPERRKVVDEYVAALQNFVECLSQFKKVLIAGVHGSTVGLGVTMLPFFDMVLASDKATFYTPYVKLGQIPEAGATLTLPHLLGNAVTSELLFGCRMLTASEALQFGLVTRILWPDKFGEELLPIARSVASHSPQSMEATKCLLRQTMNEKLQQQLDTEAKLLRQHWSSDECQRRFKDYLQQEALLQNK